MCQAYIHGSVMGYGTPPQTMVVLGPGPPLQKHQLSSVENPGWLFDIGDYTTQLYGDYNKPL